MPLPAALLARLEKRGLVKPQEKFIQKTVRVSDEVEEIFAEDYDVDEPAKPQPEVVEQPIEDVPEIKEDLPEKNEVLACPNRQNPYHECSDYCRERWGVKKFEPDEDMIKKRDRMLRHYPLPAGWKEIEDPHTNRYFYWNTETDLVSWLSPSHPRAQISMAADKLQGMLGNTAAVIANERIDERMDFDEELFEGDTSSESNPDSEDEEVVKQKQQDQIGVQGQPEGRGNLEQQGDRGNREQQGDRGNREQNGDRENRGQRGDRGNQRQQRDSGRERDGDRKGRREKQGRRDELDPMDPSSYSDVPRGSWSTGLERKGEAKTGVDSTATGPLFQQRPYPSPGDILRANRQADKS